MEHLENEFDDDTLSDFLEKSKPFQEKVDYKMRLAAKIIAGIKSKGLTKTEFAEKMEVKNRSIISKWLSGTNNFESDTLYQIEKVLGISLLNLEPVYNTIKVTHIHISAEQAFNMIDFNGGVAATVGALQVTN